MRNRKTYTEEDIRKAVAKSNSISQVIKLLNLKIGGANYKAIPNHIKDLNLNISHFTGMGHMKGKKNPYAPKIELKNILVSNSTYANVSLLRRRLIKEGIFEDKCSICGISSWLDKRLVCHLDHINGKNNDHRLENLRLLCPNCHSQTETYCGKNKGKCPR